MLSATISTADGGMESYFAVYVSATVMCEHLKTLFLSLFKE